MQVSDEVILAASMRVESPIKPHRPHILLVLCTNALCGLGAGSCVDTTSVRASNTVASQPGVRNFFIRRCALASINR